MPDFVLNVFFFFLTFIIAMYETTLFGSSTLIMVVICLLSVCQSDRCEMTVHCYFNLQISAFELLFNVFSP